MLQTIRSLALKRSLFLALVPALLLVLALSACREPQPAPVIAEPAAAQEPVRITAPAAAPLPSPALELASEAEELRAAVLELCSAHALTGAQIGVALLDLESDRLLVAVNAHEPLLPASNMKLYTTAAALATLGPDYRYETRVEATGEVRDGTLWGDLVIQGSGDPSISGRFHEGNATAVFHAWASELKALGVHEIQGDLVGDASRMEPHPGLYPGWTLDDISESYAAQTAALCLNDNCVDLTLVPGERSGDPALVRPEPPTQYVLLENDSVTSTARRPSPRLTVERRPFENVIDISGRLSTRVGQKLVTVTVEDPDEYFMTVLAETLDQEGIHVAGRARVSSLPLASSLDDRARVLVEHVSPPLLNLATVTNKESINLYAEQMLKTMGLEVLGQGSREAGIRVVSDWLRRMGVPGRDFTMYDGSGLSRLNRVSPAATLTLLRHMHASPLFAQFLSTLAVAGVDGTLNRRMRTPELQGIVRAKSGYMRGVHTLSGYVPDADGDLLAFVVMVEGPVPGDAARGLAEDVLTLARGYHGPESDQAALPGMTLPPPAAEAPATLQ